MMRVGFAGTPAFAAASLEAIAHAGFDIPLVLTQPDRPRGRGLAVQPTNVKIAAQRLRLPVLQPVSLKSTEMQAQLRETPLDVLVVAAYGLLLPPPVLAWPRHGAINIHASLLPRWRGAAPIQRAILAGDSETGITIMQMDAGLDTGPMIDVARVRISAQDTSTTLLQTLTALGAELVVRVLRRLEHEGVLASTPQPLEGATYASKIARGEAMIDWNADASAIDRQVRAFDPAPGAYTCLRGELWKVWSPQPLAQAASASPGTVIDMRDAGIDVACGSGVLRIGELQPAGGKRVGAAALLHGRRLARGDAFTPCV